MENSSSSVKGCNNKVDNKSAGMQKCQSEGENQAGQRLSTRSILSAIGSKLFSGIQMETKKVEENKIEEKKSEVEEKQVMVEKKSSKEEKKSKLKKGANYETWKRFDRDFLKFKAKYNNTMGNVLRNWMSLIYCILILRLNLIKFIQENLNELQDTDLQFQKQLKEENMSVYRLIRKAQTYSQERSFFLWMNLEKLMHSRMLIKNALEVVQGRESNKDWKAASEKLAQVEEELKNAKNAHKTLLENTLNDEVTRLENLNHSKGKELEQLIAQISALKKREVQMRGKILLSMKNYKDFNNKRKHLNFIEKEISNLTNNQNNLASNYKCKIQSMQIQLEDSEKQIKQEKEEIKKLRANLNVMGDVPINNESINET